MFDFDLRFAVAATLATLPLAAACYLVGYARGMARATRRGPR